jgi:hypothetical protein
LILPPGILSLPVNWILMRLFFSLSPRGKSGERAGERGYPKMKLLLSSTLSSLLRLEERGG